ncbi:hypothetical protein E4T52_12540 [Aureobasidium sp. EXF-3400]|nr:hypothetical protein E4T51_11491 [Aureobasidium sp. EXF-12344]KAI4772476.1 hypothetical protein E4T52_12540 [Aureobasidium sp. EXF-3400]
MAQRMTMPLAEAYPHYTMSSDHPHAPGDVLIDIVQGSDSDYDYQTGNMEDSKHRKKQVAPIQTTFHCWTLTKAAPRTRDDAPSWKRAERVQMTLSSDELGSQVKKQLKARSLTEMYEALSTDQRQQVEVLLKEKRRDETNKYACWEIAAIHREVRNNMRTRVRETTFIRVILSREDKPKVASISTEHKTAKASVASNISDLNELSDLLLKPIETKDDQFPHARKKEIKTRPKVKKNSSEDVIEVMAAPNIENPLAMNVPPMGTPLPPDQLQRYPTWSNQAPLWQPSSIHHGQEYTAQHQFNNWLPQHSLELQQTRKLHNVQDALAHMATLQPVPTESWLQQQSPPVPRASEYNHDHRPFQQYPEGAATLETPSLYESRPTNGEQDYFGRQLGQPYETVADSLFAKQPQPTYNNMATLAASPYSEDLQARRTSPSTKIKVSDDSDWPDYDPTMDQPPLPTPKTQQHKQHEQKSAERLRREDVLFWRTHAQLSDSRSTSSLDDQSSTLASPEQSSPLTSVSGDGVGLNRMWTNDPESRYDKRDEPMPGRFGQQLAAHGFLRPNQDRQREQIPVIPRRTQSDYKPPTGRNVSFEDEHFESPNIQHAPPHAHNTHNPSMYSPDIYTRPSAPDPPKSKANFQTYNPQRYQPRQHVEPENTSTLESLSERLDNMELRQAESATRRAVEAAQRRREAEKKEAYERGIEDAMAWKARSGGYDGFG